MRCAPRYRRPMAWRFAEFILSREKAELIGPDGPVAIEQRPLELLLLLVENSHRLVSKEEVCETVWNGRFISDATISTAVKMARRAVGDDGAAQTVIKTVHGKGYRFVAALQRFDDAAPPSLAPAEARAEDGRPAAPVADAPKALAPLEPAGAARPSVAVMRFAPMGEASLGRPLADAIPAELISALSRLRWARVIARGSSFRFSPETVSPADAGRQLNARYLVAGGVEAFGEMMTVSVELLLAENGELVWSDRFAGSLTDIHAIRRDICAAVLAAMELELPAFEADAARRLDQQRFDAWSHYHLGLRHIYRFTAEDNRIAAGHFDAAIARDPELARAHAGRSLSHWQDAFMRFGDDRRAPLRRALEAAEAGLKIDERDPFANFNMGRALWLQGDAAAGLPWLSRALMVNPNYAQCHYAEGMAKLLAGDAAEARGAAQLAMLLSPLDPLRYGMLGVAALSHIAERAYAEAARIADEAAASPGAHFYIAWIAAIAHELAGDRAAATLRLNRARTLRPDLSHQLFFDAFPFADGDVTARIGGALTRLGVARAA